MNLSGIDLNLLPVLHAILQEGSVTKAANRIGLSQPATSHALRRLRDHFADELFVRIGARLQPTPRAEALREPLADMLLDIEKWMEAPEFVPEHSTRRFIAMMPDLVATVLVPAIMALMAQEAPGVCLDLKPWSGMDEMDGNIGRSIDLIVSHDVHSFDGFVREPLYHDADVLAVTARHPQIDQLQTPAGFMAASHVAVAGRGEREDPVDAWLREEGVERHIVLTVPTYLQALHVAAVTDLVAFVPGTLLDATAQQLKLVRVSPPWQPGDDRQMMSYPARAKADPASLWLRSLVLRAAVGLTDNPDISVT